MKNKVSIIIPIYNCEKFLNKCLDSIVKQEYNNLEIVLINDGSTDDSLRICNERKKLDPRIIVIDKENGGVSSARNVGLENATGDFILFLDGDDYLDIDCIHKCMNLINKYSLDILKFSYVKELSKKVTKKYSYTVPLNQKIEKKDFFLKLYPYIFTTDDFCNVTIAIIKKSVIAQTKFRLNRLIGEDYLFFIECLNNANNIYFINDCFYHYIVNSESATHKFSKEKNIKKLEDSIYVNSEINNILLSKNYDSYETYAKKCSSSVYNNIQNCVTNNNYETFKKYIDNIYENDFLKGKIAELEKKFSKEVKELLSKDKKYFIGVK